MMLKMLVQDVKDEESSESETLVSEVLEIMGMMKTVRKKIVESKNGGSEDSPNSSVEKLESLLQTLRLEMVKRSILLAKKHGIGFRPLTAPVLLNGGSRVFPKEPDFILGDLSRLEEELNKAYRVARETLSNLGRLV